MATLVTLLIDNDDQPYTQTVELASAELAEEFVAKVNDLYSPRASIEATVVEPEIINTSIDAWIADELECDGFTRNQPTGGGASKGGYAKKA